MKLNDKHIGALLCLGFIYECDTTETAYDVLQYVEANNVYLPQ